MLNFDDKEEKNLPENEQSSAEEVNEVLNELEPEMPDTLSEQSSNALNEPVIENSSSTDKFEENIYAEPAPINAEDFGGEPGEDPVTVQPVKFSSFDSDPLLHGEENKNLDILMDIKLQLTVELGRCEIPIKKVLELTRGSIIELDKVAGEPVELFANGKHIANGEVVVIEDNFGLRITSITEPSERVKVSF